MTIDIKLDEELCKESNDHFGVCMRVVAELCATIRRLIGTAAIDENASLKITPHGLFGTTGDPLQGTIQFILSNKKKILKVTEVNFIIYIGEMTVRFKSSGELVSIGHVISHVFNEQIFRDALAFEHFALKCRIAR